MGLDVYLYECEDWEDALAKESECEDKSEAIWNEYGDYDNISDNDKELIRIRVKELEEEMGLADWGEDPRKKKTQIPNDWNGFKKPPVDDHIFELGYFRSSYNGSGVNHIAEKFDFPSLYDIFFSEGQSPDTYYITVNWKQALENVNAAINKIKEMNEQDSSKYDCFEVRFNTLGGLDRLKEIDSEKAALEMFIKGHANPQTGFENYSNRNGHYFGKGLQNVRAVITGAKDGLLHDGLDPVVYVVTERVFEDEYDPLMWSLYAYLYVRATIEYVLAQPNIEQYRLAWSG